MPGASDHRVVLRPRSAAWICAAVWAICALLQAQSFWALGLAGVRTLPVVLLPAVVVWALLWAPRVVVGRDRIEVRNVLTRVDLPMGSIRDVRIGAMLRFDHRDQQGRERTVTAWNAPGVGRDRAGMRLRGSARASALAGRRGVDAGLGRASWAARLRADQSASRSAIALARWEQWRAGHPGESDAGMAVRRVNVGVLAALAASVVLLVARTAIWPPS